MSLHLPSRRVLGTAPTILKALRPALVAPNATPSSTFLLQPLQLRPVSGGKHVRGVNRGRPDKPKDLHKQQLEEMTRREDGKALEDNLRKRMMATRLDSDSIFGEDLKNIEEDEYGNIKSKKAKEAEAAAPVRKSLMGASLIADHVRNAVDPDPRSRRRWERKMVIRRVTRCLDARGKETKEERLKRTEREHLSRSTWISTSTKKLMHLARQIDGKTVEEARTQMKFSKKKYAKEVLTEIETARDRAIVERGMGLGEVTGEFNPGQTDKTSVRDHRHGKWVTVSDPTRLYIHEVWVNKGPLRGKRPNFRARGRVDIIQMPQASISIRLKEEKTRVRLAEEQKAKEERRGPWIHLPNRPVTAQRPFYTW